MFQYTVHTKDIKVKQLRETKAVLFSKCKIENNRTFTRNSKLTFFHKRKRILEFAEDIGSMVTQVPL